MQVTADDVVDAKQHPSFPVLVNGNIWWQERDPKRGNTIKTNALRGAVPQVWLQRGTTIGSRVHNYGGSSFAIGHWPEGDRPRPESIGSAHANTLLCAFVRSDQALCEAGYGVAPRRMWQREDCNIGGLSVIVAPHYPSFQCIVGVIEDMKTQRDDVAVWSLEGDLLQHLVVGQFCGAPVASPSGKTLAVVAWDAPDSPWQRTRLIIAQRDSKNPEFRIIHQLNDPRWGAIVHPVLINDQTVLFSSDCAEHWDIYRWHFSDAHSSINNTAMTMMMSSGREDSVGVRSYVDRRSLGRPWLIPHGDQDGDQESRAVERIAAGAGDFALPPWQLGTKTFACLSDGRIVGALQRQGRSFLWLGGGEGKSQEFTITGYDVTCVSHVSVSGDDVVILASGSDFLPTLIRFAIPAHTDHVSGGTVDKSDDEKERNHLSAKKHFLPNMTIEHPLQSRIACWSGLGRSFSIKIPVDNDHTHAHVWLAHTHSENSQTSAAIITVHGGPTAQSWPDLNVRALYWLTRGYHWVDVNFRGSTGFGRAYRMALEGQWGAHDVTDVMAVRQYLVKKQFIRPERYIFYGSSAGGLTALLAAARPHGQNHTDQSNAQQNKDTHQAPAAVVLRYPVVDVVDLAHTHRFEQHYTQWLLGSAYDDDDTQWHARSPINHINRLGSVPILIFHGAKDPVVALSAVENFCERLTALGGNVTLKVFADEGHGFVHSETHTACAAAEEEFLARYVPRASLTDRAD